MMNMKLITKTEKRGGADRGQGRKSAAVKCDENLNMRCFKVDKQKWQAAAETQGISLSAWVIKTLNQNS